MSEKEFSQIAGRVGLTRQEEAVLRKLYNLNPNERDIPSDRRRGQEVFISASEKFKKGRRGYGD